jgi:hypothetical protein
MANTKTRRVIRGKDAFGVGFAASGVADFLRQHAALATFAVLHVLGLHLLAGAHSRRMGTVAACLLFGSAAFWVRALATAREDIGVNPATAALLASVFALAGVWLLAAGRSALEWLSGFVVVGLAVFVVLFCAGAKVLAGIVLAAAGFSVAFSGWWLRSRPDPTESAAGGDGVSRWISAVATLGLLLVFLAGAAETPKRKDDPAPTSVGLRLADLAARPVLPMGLAALLLVSGAAAVRLSRPEAAQ